MILPSLIQVQGYSSLDSSYIAQCIVNPAWPEHGLDGFTIFDSSAGL